MSNTQYPPPAFRSDDHLVNATPALKDQQHLHGSQDAVATNPTAGHSKWGLRLRLAAGLMLPTYLETLDYTIVATAQPHIASAFNALDLQSWIGTSYVLTSTVFMPVFGSFADILGRHAACQLALLFFLVGSAICTGAQSMPALLAGRGISGIGAAGLMSVVRIVMSDSASMNEDNVMNALLVIMYTVGYVTGPVIGGNLITVNFRWIFAINLPICVVSSIAIFFITRSVLKGPQPSQRRSQQQQLPVDAPNDQHPPIGPRRSIRETALHKFLRVDWIGTILFIGGGILLLLALSLGSGVEAKGFAAPVVIVSFVVGGVLLILMVLYEFMLDTYDEEPGTLHRRPRWMYMSPKWLEATDPILPIDLYRCYDIAATSFAAMTGGMVLFSAFYFLAIYFSIAKGYSASNAGQQLLYFAPGLGGGVFISMRLIKFLGQPRWGAILGTLVTPIGLGLLSNAIYKDQTTQVKVFLVITGLGVGLAFAPLGLQARFSQPANRIAIVVSMNLFFRNFGGTVGLAQLSTVLNSKVKTYIRYDLTSPNSPLDATQRASLGALFATGFNSIQSISSLDPVTLAVVQKAYSDACRWSFISLIPWCAVAFVLCLFLHNIPKERMAGPRGVVAVETPEEKYRERQGMQPGNDYAVDGAPAPEYHSTPPTGQQPQQQRQKWRVPKPRTPMMLLIWPVWWAVVQIHNRGIEN